MTDAFKVIELETFPIHPQVAKSILIVHLAYEIFVLVGRGSRDESRNIKLGLTVAQVSHCCWTLII